MRRTRVLVFKIESQIWIVEGGAHHVKIVMNEVGGVVARSGTSGSASGDNG